MTSERIFNEVLPCGEAAYEKISRRDGRVSETKLVKNGDRYGRVREETDDGELITVWDVTADIGPPARPWFPRPGAPTDVPGVFSNTSTQTLMSPPSSRFSASSRPRRSFRDVPPLARSLSPARRAQSCNRQTPCIASWSNSAPVPSG